MSYDHEKARKCLVAIIRPLADEQTKYLQRLKLESEKQGHRDDLVWFSLLSSMATMGNARGYLGLICTHKNYERVAYDALSVLRSSEARLRVLRETLRDAGIRFPDKKAAWLACNFEIMIKMGGPSAAKKRLLQVEGKESKIEFWNNFAGISDKYARNLMMDIYHPEFRDCIAIDERIKRISRELDLSFPNYAVHEEFYLRVAHELHLEGWELERLLFRFVDDVVCRLRESQI